VIDLDAPLVAQPLPKTGLVKICHRFGRRMFVETTCWQRCHRERRLGGFSRGALEFIEHNLKHRAPVGEVPMKQFGAGEAAAIAPSLDPPVHVETCVT
jgi:hypothetical protein